MNWLKQLAATPFSDLWLPVILCGLVLISLLGLHWLWLSWRVQRLNNKLNQAPTTATLAHDTVPLAAKPVVNTSDFNDLSDLHALTAQRHPVTLEEQTQPETPYIPSTQLVAERLDPTFDLSDMARDSSIDVPIYLEPLTEPLAPLTPTEPQTTAQEPIPQAQALAADMPVDSPTNVLSEEAVFFKPHSTVLLAKAPVPVAPAVHPVFHYAMRLTWIDAASKASLNEAIEANPWVHALPVIWSLDANDDCSMLAALQVASRRELASEADAQLFKAWCDTIASSTAGRCERVSIAPWESFLDEAHGLLIRLDSVIVLKVAVPTVQLDLFTQSLLAARFTQAQEHWYYQEQDTSTKIWLERLWHQGAADANANPPAVFQVMIDIPHLDALEARKVYMRLRAVARTSAAILQSGQGVHLAEGMLDRYSRELMMKQDALTQADVAPGSLLAKQLFKPQLSLSQDLGA